MTDTEFASMAEDLRQTAIRAAMRILPDYHHAEDVAQVALYETWQAIARQVTASPFYLVKLVATRRARDRVKHLSRRPALRTLHGDPPNSTRQAYVDAQDRDTPQRYGYRESMRLYRRHMSGCAACRQGEEL